MSQKQCLAISEGWARLCTAACVCVCVRLCEICDVCEVGVCHVWLCNVCDVCDMGRM